MDFPSRLLSDQSLRRAIEHFASIRPELADPAQAKGACQDASARFIDLLLERGIISREHRDWEVEEIVFENEPTPLQPQVYPRTYDTNHRVARIGSLRVDWTARQFRPDAPFPFIWSE